MMPCKFTDASGREATLDLDNVVDVADGWSRLRDGWQALLVYDPAGHRFVELQSTVPGVRGNSADEALEVAPEYVRETFGLTDVELQQLRRNPRRWRFLKRRA